jgi:EmrB/QacA subfamily drug resistance transporter
MVVLFYQIFETSFLLAFGKLGDIKSFKFVYILGFIVFTIGSLFCGLSQNLTHLVGARIIQGIGGAMLFAVMMATVAAFIPLEHRGKSVGMVITAAAAGIALGPPIGGFISSEFNWRWIFFVNVPIGILAVIGGLIFLPSKQAKCKDPRFDYIGAAASFISLLSLVCGIELLHKHGPVVSSVIVWFSVFIISTIFFIFWEKRISYPLLDLELFINRNFTLCSLASIPPFMNYAGLLFILPFYFEIGRHLDVKTSGLIIAIIAIGQMLGPYSGHLADKIGAKKILLAGLFLGIISFMILAFMGNSAPIILIVIALALQGISSGFGRGTNIQMTLEYCSPDKKGIASSVVSISRSLAILLGTLAFTQVFTLSSHGLKPVPPHSLSRTLLSYDVVMNSFHNVFIFGLVLSVAALLLILLVRDNEKTSVSK